MHAEVQKTSEFFVGMEQQMALRKKRIKQGITYVKHTVPASDIEARHRIRRACVSFYKDLLLLENFAIINYTGYSKAAKKHDKNTGCVAAPPSRRILPPLRTSNLVGGLAAALLILVLAPADSSHAPAS
jgi:SPX domain protein involved in polyphosphate accumulation